MVFHGITRSDGLVLRELGELALPAGVLNRGATDDEVGGEHAGSDFAAVGAVADEGVDQVVARGGLVTLTG